MRHHKTLSGILLILSLSGCTSYRAFEKAREYEMLKDWDNAVVQHSKALQVDPDNMRYKISLHRAKLEASRVHFDKGKEFAAAAFEEQKRGNWLAASRHYELAALEYELTVKLDPTNQFAAVELVKAVEGLRNANAKVSGRLSIDEIKRRAITKAQPPQLDPASDEPISLSFPRETPVKDIYRALGNSFGINIMFDQQVKDDRISIELRDVTAQQALERVMQAANHFYKVLDEKTIIIVPDNPQARRDYEDLVIQTFYLSNGDAEQVTNVVRTMIEARHVFPLKALNAITVRDTADKVRIAKEIIEANDKARAEVVVDVELLQLDVTKVREVGVQLLTGSSPYSPLLSAIDNEGSALTSVTIDQLRALTSENWTMTIPSVAYGFLKTHSGAQLLAKPQLRISEGEKATLHIGQKIPLPVSTFTSAAVGGAGTFAPVTSFTYTDVGIKISIEPRVHHNREVTLKLLVEVSNLAGFAPATSPPQPIIDTRTIESTIRLKDGETNFLAGLIRKDDSTALNSIPFVGDLPILGRLFSRDRKDFQSTDLVLTMSPHIIRIPDITEDDLAPMWVGTSNNLTFRGVSPRIESQTRIDPFNNTAPTERQAVSQEEPPRPTAVVPQVQPPRDIFREAQPPAPPPPSVLPLPVHRRPPPPPQGSPQGSLNREPSGDYSVTLGARLAPQPIQLSLRPGEEKLWNIVGMELDGLSTTELSLRFDPRSIEVSEVMLGTALEINPEAPPVVGIDPISGTVRITSSDGKPLRFRTGGDVVALRVRGGEASETILAIDPPAFFTGSGQPAVAAVAGGRAKVE